MLHVAAATGLSLLVRKQVEIFYLKCCLNTGVAETMEFQTNNVHKSLQITKVDFI